MKKPKNEGIMYVPELTEDGEYIHLYKNEDEYKKEKKNMKWAEIAMDAIEKSGVKIPCMKAVTRGKGDKYEVRVNTFGRFGSLAEIIKDSRESPYKTLSDVLKDVVYKGFSVVWQEQKRRLKGKDLMWGSAIMKSLEETVETVKEMIIYDCVLDAMKSHVSHFKKGLNKDPQVLHDQVTKSIEDLPENFRDAAWNDFLKLRSGGNISEMYFTREHGGSPEARKANG